MKHRRSIDLVASHEEVATDRETLATLPQWYVIQAQCPACQRETRIDRRVLAYRYGKDISLARISLRLKCSGCGNRTGNQLLLGRLPRD
ncbi:hypothetical protein LVY75_23765 [Sinorhizobium sp. B11]|jgi:ribosomal protein L44E|uniref:hypothetical protein n=1 Tax=unclassified Rhizobium TaxID=2613769 RepID=UPI00037D0ED6|nr:MULTISPECIES: hypothetical protein [unclassified Rhizobium]MBB3441477.1 ribosomal protein L44E [Rhizobium sp. BK379]MBB3558982.1 ribosomal protein L44E [Rhizobium sp. BK512]